MRTFALVFLLAVNGVQAEMISTGVGLVRNQAVTSREVQMLNLLEIALYDPKPQSKLKLLGLDSKAFAKAAQDALLEAVVAQEAQSFNVLPVTPEELRLAERQALKILAPTRDWKSLGLQSREVQAGLSRKLQAKKFIQFRADSSVLPVTDVEAQRYFTENRKDYGELPFENYRDGIKSSLSKTQVDKRLKDWFDVLTAKYQVKNLISEM